MKIKVIILFLIIIFNFLVMQPAAAEAKGIIIADDQEILEIFRDYDQAQIIELAWEISKYDKVILHLGAQKIFSRGHPFFYRSSQENLIIFAEQLQKQNQDFYLWFLDSFGSEMFLDIYDNHQEIIDANHSQLEELNFNYDGIIIDLEWINLGLESDSGDNQNKYLEILEALKNKFSDKELYAFMSIVNDEAENLRRGYNQEKIIKYLDNIIVMLYVKDAGFYLANNQLNMSLRDRRIDDLRNYYQENNYQTAVSLEGGIFLERNNELYFIKTTNQFDYIDQSQLLYRKEKKYYIISAHNPRTDIILRRNDGQLVEFEENDRLHFLKIKAENILTETDYIWEYFQMQQ